VIHCLQSTIHIQGDSGEKVSILGGKSVRVCLILNGYRYTEPFEFTDLSRLDFCLWGWMKCEFCNMEVDTRYEFRYELLSVILDTTASIKTHEDQLR